MPSANNNSPDPEGWSCMGHGFGYEFFWEGMDSWCPVYTPSRPSRCGKPGAGGLWPNEQRPADATLRCGGLCPSSALVICCGDRAPAAVRPLIC